MTKKPQKPRKKEPPKSKDSKTLTLETKKTGGVQGWLGCGIHLFDFDPDYPSTKPARILAPTLGRSDVVHQSHSALGYSETYGDSLLDITHKLTVEAGLKGAYGKAFSSSINTRYHLTKQKTEKKHFLKISFTLSHLDYELKPGIEDLKKLLDPSFKNALAKWNPDRIFEEYGTHFIRKITIGGRAEYMCHSSDFSSITEQEFKTAAKAKYKAAGGSVEGTNDVTTVDQEKLNLVEGELGLRTVGGAPKAASELAGAHKRENWTAWADSCDAHPAFLAIDQKNGLLPIWQLADDDARGSEIHRAYKRAAAKTFRTAIVSVTSPKDSHAPEARVTVPEGYKLLSGGARIDYRAGGNMLTASFPEGDNAWRANGHDLKVSDEEKITAFAIALYDPEDLWEVRIFHDTLDRIDVRPMKEVTVGPDYAMVGGGVHVHDAETIHSNLLIASFPLNDTTWRVQSKEHYDISGAKITAYAVGLKCKVEGVAIRSDIQRTESDSTDTKTSAQIGPKSGYVMTGGGAVAHLDFSRPGWGIRMNELRSGQLLTKSCPVPDENIWLGEAKDHLYPYKTKLSVQCIGVKVVNAA